MSEFARIPALTLLPAVDVSSGKAVRLTQGEAGTETNYGDPIDAAHEWADQGAEWIHLVDLDAAFGRGNNRGVIKKVVKTTPKRVNIELSGGIRDDASLEAALATGAKRINLGTAALENPEWAAHVIAEYGEAIAVGLDVRGTTLAARGWTEEGGDLWAVLDRLELAGCARYVVTDVTKDGMLRARTWSCCARSWNTRTARSSRREACRASMTSPRCANSCRSGSRARSSARRSTRGRLPCRKRSTSRAASAACGAVTMPRADSAGQPWEGRRFEANPSAADDGSAPPAYLSAHAALRAGTMTLREVVDVVRECRFLIPLVAVEGEGETQLSDTGMRVDGSQELSIITVSGPDGRAILPVFSSVEAMTHWRADARPVPADAVRVALAAASENTDRMVIDPRAETELVLPRPAVWAIAQQAPWVPAVEDDAVV